MNDSGIESEVAKTVKKDGKNDSTDLGFEAKLDTATVTIKKRFWAAADQFRTNSGFKTQEYSGPTLGLIFLRFAARVRRRRPCGNRLVGTRRDEVFCDYICP